MHLEGPIRPIVSRITIHWPSFYRSSSCFGRRCRQDPKKNNFRRSVIGHGAWLLEDGVEADIAVRDIVLLLLDCSRNPAAASISS